MAGEKLRADDSQRPIKVILADDHDRTREAISRLLIESSEVQLVAEANSFRKLKELVKKYHPDVVVSDLHLNDEKTFTVSQTKTLLRGSQLVAISLRNDEQTTAFAMSIGAFKLLDKRPATSRTEYVHQLIGKPDVYRSSRG